MSKPPPLFRELPGVDSLLKDPRLAALPHDVVVPQARAVLDDLRDAIKGGTLEAMPDVAGLVEARCQLLLRGRLVPVINATGIVVHTNLGRAPWAPEAVAAAATVAGYTNLEMDLPSGSRGGRLEAVSRLLSHLTGAERGIVVNNCAAAVLLALTALARDREVIVSRGQLVEIGGSFRVPDVIAAGGARLREVGTTNRTRIDDYARAIGPDTAVLLRAHPSNFRVVGFTEEAPLAELTALAHRHGLPVVDDQGSGSMDGTLGAPSVRSAIADGADVVTFSGDKLLGGPQAGFLVGRADVIGQLRSHPLYRALRVDKTLLAAIEATLAMHARGAPTPVQRMIDADPQALRAAAEALCAALKAEDVEAHLEDDEGFVGGGALPGEALPSVVVCVVAPDLPAATARLRTGNPAVVARAADGSMRLDPRTMLDEDPAVVARAVAIAVHPR